LKNLKHSGVEYILIDEISMINSKIWGVLSDIKKKCNFKFVLLGDFSQLPPVENKYMMSKIAKFSAPGTSGSTKSLSSIWPVSYSFYIIIASTYIVLGTGPDCKPAPVPGLLSKKQFFNPSTASRGCFVRY
jgi:hypothetical protein